MNGLSKNSKVIARHYLSDGFSVAIVRHGDANDHVFHVGRFDRLDNFNVDETTLTEVDARQGANRLWLECTKRG